MGNVLAALITLPELLRALPLADMDDVFFMISEPVAFLWVLRIAWKSSSLV